MKSNREIEFKAAIVAGDAARVARTALLREKCIGRPKRRRVFNLYFDTGDSALRFAGLALRLRRIGRRWLQTLKSADHAESALHQRGEWEFPARGPILDLSLFRDTPLAALPGAKDLHLQLQPVFATDYRRDTWLVEMRPGQRVEVALDRGFIRHGELSEPICELEIESTLGDADTIFDVALALAAQISLRPEPRSKAERGYRLVAQEPPAPRCAEDVALAHIRTPDDAVPLVLGECYHHFLHNVEGGLGEDDPEYVHQMRVALRRLWAALRLFHFQREEIAPALKTLAARLGAARDWDVFVTKTLPALLENYSAAPTKHLIAAAEGQRAKARRAMRAALRSRGFAKFSVSLERAIVDRNAATGLNHSEEAAPETLSRFARRKIRRYRRSLADGKGRLADQPAEDRHRLRIAIKRLRYAVEFFSSVLDEKHLPRYLRTLSEIQDRLGEANDGNVALKLLGSLSPAPRFQTFARAWVEARTRICLRDADRLLRKLHP